MIPGPPNTHSRGDPMSFRDAKSLEFADEPELGKAARVDTVGYPQLSSEQEFRLAQMLNTHFASVWRAGRRVGLSQARAEENAQETFAIAARKLDRIERGRERAYLLGVAIRLANNTLRLSSTRLERTEVEHEDTRGMDNRPLADDILIRKQQLQVLDDILQSMTVAFREVLTLYEIEELTLHEIAELLGIPEGTATSRLRRAREEFSRIVRRKSVKQASLEEDR